MRRSQTGLFHHRLIVGQTSATNAAEQMAMVAIPIQIIKHTHLSVTTEHACNGLHRYRGSAVFICCILRVVYNPQMAAKLNW